MDCFIDMLPVDKLLTIFEYLDAKTLKKAALVCKKWNDIIGQSACTMSKFKIRVDQFKNYDNIMQVNRMVYTLAVMFEMESYFNNGPVIENLITVERKVKMLRDICSLHGSKIRIFYIYNGQFDDPMDFSNILQSMPMLEKFNSQKMNLNFVHGSDISVEPVIMPRLKKLQVSMTGFNFRYLLGSQPKNLSLMNLQQKEMSFLNEFIETLNKLETLALYGCIAINMFLEGENKTFGFKLKYLKIDLSGSNVEAINEMNVINFLQSQAPSLEELSLRNVSGKILEALLQLSSLQLLNKLEVYSFLTGWRLHDSFPENTEFYDSLQPYKNLKELIFDGPLKDEIAAMGILRHCPSLHKLVLRRYAVDLNTITAIATCCPNIIHLEINQLRAACNLATKLTSLKSLKITTIFEDDIGNVTSFLKVNPTIERLVIDRTHIKPELPFIEFLQTLIEMPNLKYLEINGIADILKAIYDKFTTPEYNGSLCLVLHFDRMGLGTPKVKFNIPQEAGQWDTKCAFVKKFVRTPRTDFLYRLSH